MEQQHDLPPIDWQELGIDTKGRTHGNLKTQCPRCSHTRKNRREPCLSVNLDKNTWLCHHCGWKGPEEGYARERGQLDDLSPAQKVYRQRERKPVYEKPHVPEQKGETSRLEAFFTSRGISRDTWESFHIVDDGRSICFPFYRNGELVNVKHRGPNKRFWMEAGAELIMWGLDECAGEDTVIVVEGEMDRLALAEAGFRNVLSVPSGAPSVETDISNAKLDYLPSAEGVFAEARQVILAGDMDKPGQRLVEELSRRIGREKCWRVEWPEGCKDANDVLMHHGIDLIWEAIDQKIPYPVEGIVTADHLSGDLDDLYDFGVDPGLRISPAYPVLNQHYRVKTGYMSIVTGIPGHGKSGVVDNIIVRLAEQHGWSFAIFSPEQQPAHKHFQHLIEIHAGQPMLQGPTARMSKEDMHRHRSWVSDHFSMLVPEEPSIDTILELAAVEVYRRGVKGIVVDPWNELEHMRPRHLSETEYISEALSKFRRFAIKYDVHIWIIAHPTKIRRNEDGTEPVPSLYDIAGSANFRNKADMGMTVWRDISANDSQVEVHITKVRYQDQGRLGAVRFGYEPASKTIYEMGEVE